MRKRKKMNGNFGSGMRFSSSYAHERTTNAAGIHPESFFLDIFFFVA
jgi:hypothetical protein